MKTRYNIPIRVSWQGELRSDEKTRVERAIFLAIERAVKSMAEQGSEIAAAEIQGAEVTSERFESPRYRSDTNTYAIPSYQTQGQTGATVSVPVTPPLRQFDDIYAQFQQHRMLGRNDAAAALIPDLIAHMSPEDARRHAIELAFWLMDRGDWSQARAALRELEDGWWLQYVTTGIPINLAMMPDTPRRLYERARAEALTGRHEQAFRLLGLAYLFTQFIVHDASQTRLTELENLSQRLGEAGRAQAPYLSAMTRIISYGNLTPVYDLLRDIVGLYPRLEREAIRAGKADQARQYSGLGLVARMELRDNYTLSAVSALTMESAATTTAFGEAGYTIYGRDLTATETVTPLPGTRTPEELGAFPSYTATMEALLESVAGQEEYLTELFAYPEIRTEFRGGLPDMNRLNDRLRVWRAMYRTYQHESMFPLGALMSLIRRYLEGFTFHSEYNIRDYGVSYLSTDFPVDLAGRAVRDCGVYALMTAYEVYQTARSASPQLNLDFRLYVMPEHVILVIADRDEGNFYLVNNNQIIGPRRGDEIPVVAGAYGQVFGRRFGVAAGVTVNLGSTATPEATFRRDIWDRYRVGVATGLRPERPTGAGPDISDAEVTQYTYRRYYEDLARFDTGAQVLAGRLEQLRHETAGLQDEQARARLGAQLPDLTNAGRTLTLIFAQRGAQAHIIVDERRARAVLGRDFARRVPQIVGREHIFLFTHAQSHPLARLAMALLRFERLGGTLSTDAQNLIHALRLIREFDADINAYDQAGRPAAF